MKDTMYHHAVEFIRELRTISNRIFPNTVDTDKQVAGNFISFAIIKRDDIGKIIVLEVFQVHVQDVIIRTENNRDVSQPADLTFGDQAEPAVVALLALENEGGILVKIRNHGLPFFRLQIYDKFVEIMSGKAKILLLLGFIILASCQSGSRYYTDIAADPGNNPDSLLAVLESRTPEADSAPNKRKEHEYIILHQIAFSCLYGFADVSAKEKVAAAVAYFTKWHNRPMQVMGLDAMGRILYSENDFNGALKCYAEALKKMDWKKQSPYAQKICSAMALCYQAAGIDINEGQYLFFAYQGFNASRIRNERIRLIALALFFLAITASLVWYFKARKIAIEQELEQTRAEAEESMAIAEDLKARLTAMKDNSPAGTDVLERLCAQFYVNEGSDRLQGSIVKEVRSIIDGLRRDKAVQAKIEDSLNSAHNNVMNRLRESFPKWKEEDFHIYAYTAAGFSSTTIATLLEKDKPFVYNRLYRLKSRIQSSDLPDKDFFLEVLQ